MTPTPRSAGGARGVRLATALTLAVAAADALGAAFPGYFTWGIHAYAFVPIAWAWVAGSALAAAIAVAWWSPPWGRLSDRILARMWHPLPLVSAMALAVAALWHWRIVHVLLGDGLVIAWPNNVDFIDQLEPLASLAQRWGRDFLAPLMVDRGYPADRAFWGAAALTSVAAGALMVPVALGIGSELARLASKAGREPLEPTTTVMIALCLLTQGYVQVLFGYVEVYSLVLVCLAAHVWASLRWIDGRGSLFASGLTLLIAASVHLSASVALLPFAYLVLRSLAEPSTRRRTVADLAGLVIVGAGLMASLRWLTGAWLPASLWTVGRHILGGDFGRGLSARMTPHHVLDQLNELALIGPLGAWLFAPAVALAWSARPARRPAALWLTLLGAAALVPCLVAEDSNLGFARNWDLLAPLALPMTVAGLGLWMLARASDGPPRRALFLLLVLSVVHTAPWIALNTSIKSSVERFRLLPLGLGRVESTLATWYRATGDPGAARLWYGRALTEFPDNPRAYVGLGDLDMSAGNYREAARDYQEALRRRPDKEAFRWRLVDALTRGGRWDEAGSALQPLLEGTPSTKVWLASAMLEAARGDTAGARRALDRAGQLDPESPLYGVSLRYLSRPELASHLLQDLWPMLGD